ncbi:hypothetical protein C4573_01140 [Candidatus Woesearchaeota archaeon]|nr:MAG: hypothetical protein C4573_01140 [Candidatus Woesearchaeota archaeon]
MDLLNVKKAIKKRNPVFIRQDAHKRKSLAKKWIRPKGIQSKMRLHLRSYRRVVKPGYGTPAALRGLNKEGKKEYLISSVKDLEHIPAGSSIVFSGNLGARKKLILIDLAKKKNFLFVNVNPETFALQVKKKQDEKKAIKKKISEKKSLEQKIKKKEEKPAELTDEERKKKEKEEKDKVLTQK